MIVNYSKMLPLINLVSTNMRSVQIFLEIPIQNFCFNLKNLCTWKMVVAQLVERALRDTRGQQFDSSQ